MSKAVKHFRDLLFNYPQQIRYIVKRKDIEDLIREIDEYTKVVDAVAKLNYERSDSIRPMTNPRHEAEQGVEYTRRRREERAEETG